MEAMFRIALVDWLKSDGALAATLNDITEEAPSRASHPWLGIAASASTDWSTKDHRGREVRVALELQTRGQSADETAQLVTLIEALIDAMPRTQNGFTIANATFLRARAEQRPRHTRAVLLEYRFRLLAL